MEVAEQAAGGLQTSEGELAAARRLDAEDATMAQVLAWAMGHDAGIALRLAAALAPWWFLRGRLAAQYTLLGEVAGRAEPGSAGWCAARSWLGTTARFSADMAGAMGHFTAVRDAVRDQGPSRVLADALVGRSTALRELGRAAEAADDARSALALARDIGYPGGEALALRELTQIAMHTDDLDSAVRLGRQATQITVGIPGRIGRACTASLAGALIEAGDLAAAEGVCAAALASFRDAGHLENLTQLLSQMALLELNMGRVDDGAVHLREAVQIAARIGFWFELINNLDSCGYLCAATGRHAEAITAWAAFAALSRRLAVFETPAMPRQRQEPLRQWLACVHGPAYTGSGQHPHNRRRRPARRASRTGLARAGHDPQPDTGILRAREWAACGGHGRDLDRHSGGRSGPAAAPR